MKVSELAAQSGVALATIKYYLREGLLMPGEPTSATGARYGEQHVRRLALIRAWPGRDSRFHGFARCSNWWTLTSDPNSRLSAAQSRNYPRTSNLNRIQSSPELARFWSFSVRFSSRGTWRSRTSSGH